jgi:molybdate transport system regulatory protein
MAQCGMARLRVSIVFESGVRIDPGKVKLLESIVTPARSRPPRVTMGMSHKRAWLLLDSISKAFIEPVVTAAPTGSGGGGATLTLFGAEVLKQYRRLNDRAAAMAAMIWLRSGDGCGQRRPQG